MPSSDLLSAGPLSLELIDDDVRAVRWGDDEVLQRIYVGIRTTEWATVPGTVVDRSIDREPDAVRVRLVVVHEGDGLAVEVRIRMELSAAGRLDYRAEVEARTDFSYNRMGICVLHPQELAAGRPYRARGVDGEITGRLPELIAPQEVRGGDNQPLFPGFEELELETGPASVRLAFAGDTFETEDQRNWSDGSFKTYGIPAGLGLPHVIRAGDVLRQELSLQCTSSPRPARPRPDAVRVEVGDPADGRLPALGLALPADAGAVRALAPAHLRIRLDLGEDAWPRALADGEAAARDAGAGLEVALLVDAGSRRQVAAAVEALVAAGAPLHRLLVLPRGGEGVTDDAWVREVRARVARTLPGVPLGAGTEGPFADLNRAAPRAALDLLAWGLSPQVHATDARSIMETPPVHALTVRTAAALRPDAGFAVGPVAVGPGRRLDEGLGPAWAALAVMYLAEAGAGSVTFDLEGAGPPASLGALAGWHGAEVLAATSDDPGRAGVLALRRDGATRLLVVNRTSEEQAVELAVGRAPSRALALGPYGVEVVDA